MACWVRRTDEDLLIAGRIVRAAESSLVSDVIRLGPFLPRMGRCTGSACPTRPLSSCVHGEAERVLACRLSASGAVELVGSDGGAVRRLSGVTLFLKDSPAAIQSCGGIGTWSEPAA